MYFTQEDFIKIEKYLQSRGRKDTDFSAANRPLLGDELLAIIQEDSNKLLSVEEFASDLSSHVVIEGYTYIGVAKPTDSPIESTHGLFYIAGEKGIYENFGGIELDGTILAVLKKESNSSEWMVDLFGVRLDAVDIANNAKAIADQAIGIANKFQGDLAIVQDKAVSAEQIALNASKTANEAIDKANNSVKLSDRGKPGGVPILDGNGLIPKSQLPIMEIELVNSYMSDRTDAAPTAKALHDLYKFHEEDIINMHNTLDAILDLVSDSSEIGVAPTEIRITSLAQSVKAQVICNGTWNVQALPAGVTASPMSGTGNATITLSFAANPSETEQRTGVINITNSFGKSKSINYVQFSASVRWEYSLSVIPTSVNVSAAAGSGSFTINSIRTPYINTEPSGDPENVAFNMSVPSGITWIKLDSANPTSYNYTENILEAPRASKIIVTQEDVAGKSVDIPITQAMATVNTVYKFTIEPENASIIDSGVGGTYPAKITSTKTVTVNETSTTTDVPYIVTYSGGASSDWVVYSKENNNIVIPLNNLETARTGAIVFTQESPDTTQITVPITQAPAIVDYVYVFEYTPTSMSFGNAAGSKNYTVTKSIKQKRINGEPTGDETYVDWDVNITGTGFTLNKDTSTVSAAENIGAQRAGTLTFTRAEVPDQNKTIAITQAAGIVTWEFSISASANPTNIEPVSGTTVLTVNSIKQKYINGKPDGSPVQVAWHGVSTNGYLTGADTSGSTWTMVNNNTESSRSDSITVSQLESGGKSAKVDVVQKSGVVTWDYSFSLSPTSMSFGRMGESKSFSANSTKQKKINGSNSGTPVTVQYIQTTSDANGFSVSGTNISASENTTTSSRSNTFTFTQNESNKTATIECTQEAGVETWEYEFSFPTPSYNVPWSSNSITVPITSTKKRIINGNPTSEVKNVPFSFYEGVDWVEERQVGPGQILMNIGTSLLTLGRSTDIVYEQQEGDFKLATVTINQGEAPFLLSAYSFSSGLRLNGKLLTSGPASIENKMNNVIGGFTNAAMHSSFQVQILKGADGTVLPVTGSSSNNEAYYTTTVIEGNKVAISKQGQGTASSGVFTITVNDSGDSRTFVIQTPQ